MQACNSIGCGPWSGWQAARTPPAPVDVDWRKDGSAVGQPGCSHSSCAWVYTTATGLNPGQTYTVTCHGSGQGAYSATQRTADGNGRLTDRSCYFGYPAETFWMTVGPYESEHRVWGN